MLERRKLIDTYTKYGFQVQKGISDDVIVFSIKTGHYHNADIIPLRDNVENIINDTFDQYKKLGYACQVKKYISYEEAQKALFDGFFSLNSTKKRLKREYKQFTDSIVKIYSEDAKYSYIQSTYQINGELGNKNVISEIWERLKEKKPILFLIEAAAGFGKTCTAYELLNHIINEDENRIPLFSELSRNRQAKLFRYVLLDEIDRSFPLLSSSLVRKEIRNGNVPVILDGFDELLHESASDEDRNYENTEPMLETISELLTDQAKVILTTRRTAILDGDEFHQWMCSHENDFEIIRIRIHEPKIEDWLCKERLDSILCSKFPIHNISNPVLLSFLRCISDDEFEDVKSNLGELVTKYFSSMLERERTRQDLSMSQEEQYNILSKIADDMIDLNYTSESREYFCSLISENNSTKLEEIRRRYAIDVRPTTDELINKLASHALLDRSSGDTQGIGFVNEFVLGNFCAESIIKESTGEWSGDKRFIEPAIQSYLPRSASDKEILWNSLEFVLEFMSGSDKIRFNHALMGCMKMDLRDDSVDKLTISNLNLGDMAELKNVIFIDCQFSDSIFTLKNMDQVTFINTVFFDCVPIGDNKKSQIYFCGCDANNDFIALLEDDDTVEEENHYSDCDKYILQKFWPVGSDSCYKHRSIKGICSLSNQHTHSDILFSIKKLKKEKILLTPDKRSFLELNVELMAEIKLILGRQ